MQATATDAMLDVNSAAALAAVHPETIRRAVRRGDLSSVRTGRGHASRYRFAREWILRWLRSNGARP